MAIDPQSLPAWQHHLFLPTMNPETEEYEKPLVPVTVKTSTEGWLEGGLRIILGDPRKSRYVPEVHLERGVGEWVLVVSGADGETLAFVYIADDGRATLCDSQGQTIHQYNPHTPAEQPDGP